MVRTQFYIDEIMHARLQDLARKQGRTLSELVREALIRAYGEGEPEERLDTLNAIRGIWHDRDDVGGMESERLRGDAGRRPRPRR